MASTHQHHVPQFILRGFASGRSKQIYVFDKATGKSFKTAVRNVASEMGFYDFDAAGEARSLDPLLQRLEDATKEIVRKILQLRLVNCLSPEERVRLALFATTQMLRTTAQRRQLFDLNQSICEAVKKRGGDPDSIEGFRNLTEEEARVASIMMIPQLARDLAPHFVEKSWVVYAAPPQAKFYISDSPVTLQNTMNQDPVRGTLGLGVRGIEIYFPLSGTLCLGFLCGSIEEMIRDGHSRMKRLGIADPSMDGWIGALNGDGPLGLQGDNVTNLNSLQFIRAERYVFSSDGDFGLAREMLEMHPELKAGPRLAVA
jgi:hypothetical protein